ARGLRGLVAPALGLAAGLAFGLPGAEPAGPAALAAQHQHPEQQQRQQADQGDQLLGVEGLAEKGHGSGWSLGGSAARCGASECTWSFQAVSSSVGAAAGSAGLRRTAQTTAATPMTTRTRTIRVGVMAGSLVKYDVWNQSAPEAWPFRPSRRGRRRPDRSAGGRG